jgi:MOB kinase activator 1
MSNTEIIRGVGRVRSALGIFPEHSGIYKLHLQTQATLGTAKVRDSVRLPPYIPEDEWIAAQLLTHLMQAEHVVNLMHDICVEETCPCMNAGEHMNYAWTDDANPVPQEMCAYQYMRKTINYTEEKMRDRMLFPLDGSPFPAQYMPTMKTLCKRVFRIYAHVYLSHIEIFYHFKADAALNLYFKHFLYFVREFKLVSEKDMSPLDKLIKQFLEKDAAYDAVCSPSEKCRYLKH